MSKEKLRLFLVDDHEILRAGLRLLFHSYAEFEIIGEADNGADAVVQVCHLRPDVVIMDVAMPGMNGIEATRRIRDSCPDVAVLALTMHQDEQYVIPILRAGAAGYIPKQAAPDDLVAAIHAVVEGHLFLHSSLAQLLVQETSSLNDTSASILTDREREVLSLIANGDTSRSIADKLSISIKTVDRHRENIMRKLDIHKLADLVRFALTRGIIAEE